MSMHIFGDQATKEKAENVRLSSFVGALGMNKILQSGSTGDINLYRFEDRGTVVGQDDEVGDGTTTVCVLASELLREAEKLIAMKIHLKTIVEGYRLASRAALDALEKVAVDHGSDVERFHQDLFNIAKTTLSSKVLSQDKDYFVNLAIDVVLRLKGSTDPEHIQIIKIVGGKLTDSYLDEGFILDRSIAVNSPKRMENVKILIGNTSMDTDKIKVFSAPVKVDSTGKLAELERAEREKMKAKVEAITAHSINCFSLLAEKGILVIEHADFERVERLLQVHTLDRPDLVKLGRCELIKEIIICEEKLIKFSGVAASEALYRRPARFHKLDLKETRIVLGGGCSEMLTSCTVDEAARKVKSKNAIATEAFGRALRQIPTILADNAGYDSSDLVARLRAAHYEDMNEGIIGSMKALGITKSYKLKRQVVFSATQAAEMIIGVDDILRATPRKREAV
ncbi:hypothetical protein OG21DRAFT_1479646 [Imleria badia]|nr:hypothetical protein OG21DRAFT_1479646 [Imleria badia]